MLTYCNEPVTPKSVPPKIDPAELILAKKPAKTGSGDQFLLPKSVWLDKLVPPSLPEMGAYFIRDNSRISDHNLRYSVTETL